MNKRGTKFVSGGLLIGSLLALAVLLTAGTARAGNPPGAAVSLAQRIKARIQPGLPAHLRVAEVSLPAALVPFSNEQLSVETPQISEEGTVNVLVILRKGDQEARAWVRVLIEAAPHA